jgi:hypothetical protein
MAGRLVTIATFGEITEAHIAQNALEAAGIKTAISDEDTSPVLGQFVNPVSGFKVLVQADDEVQAVKVLDETFSDKPPPEEELAAQSEAAGAEDVLEPPAVETPASVTASREKDARTALLAACIGVLIPFAHLFAIVMILNAATGPGELSRRGRWHVYAAVLVICFYWIPLIILLLLLSR